MRYVVCIAMTAALLGGCVTVENAPERIRVKVPNFDIPILGDSEEGVSLIAYDHLARPDRPVRLVAELMSVRKDFPVDDITLCFRHDGQLIAQTLSDSAGLADAFWTPPGVGDYRITAEIVDVAYRRQRELLELPPVDMVLSIREPTAPFIVVDLDRTLVGSSFFHVMIDRAEPMAGSQKVMQRLARDYNVIYLTHRPLHFTPLSRAWLDRHDFPTGPLFSSTIDEFFDGSGPYKTARLADIRQTFRNLQVGIGDKAGDVLAYHANGMEAYWIPHLDDDADDRIEQAHAIAEIRKENIYVADSWEAIEAGIYRGKHLSPQQFAQRVIEQAKQELRHRWRWHDDDDETPPAQDEDQKQDHRGWI
jgi:hypothetical protein